MYTHTSNRGPLMKMKDRSKEQRRRIRISVRIIALCKFIAWLPLVDGNWYATSSGCTKNAFYTIDLTKVYSLDSQVPPGCQCKETGVTDADCKYFDCSCLCDLTAGKCDLDCCCDSECSPAEIARFKALGTCLPEGPVDSSISSCYNTGALGAVNPSFPLGVVSSSQKALDQLLCVQTDNNEVKGGFLQDPGYPGSTAFSLLSGSKDYYYGSSSSDDGGGDYISVDSTYDLGDPIPTAFAYGSTSARAAYGGYMPIPAPGINGECNENNYAGFGVTVSSMECSRVIDPTTISTDCNHLFGAARFTNLLQISPTPDISPSAGIESYSNITVNQITYRNPTTLTESSFTSYDCDAYYSTTATTTGTCAAIQAHTGSTGYCRNALVAACYTITHNGAGTIISATADLVVTDIGVSGTSPFSITQSYSVAFVSNSAITRISTAGNLMDRSRSGNPGYLTGYPVLAGYAIRGNTAIDAQIDGMIVQATTSGGLCTDTFQGVPVGFGVDLQGGCSLELTRSELATMCAGGGSYMGSTGIPTFFSVNATHVGIFGNADPLDYSQWLALDQSFAAATYTWDDAAGTCRDMYTSFEYKFLTANVGSNANPQSKIIAAQVSLGKEDLHFRTQTGTQRFAFTTSASFVPYQEEASTFYTPPAPPVIFTVPYDVFYPFTR